MGLARPAAVIRTPECQRDLTAANQLLTDVQQRETRLNAAVGRKDTAGVCGFLRENARDMTGARERMNRCVTGFEQRENIGQIDASLGDIRDVLAARCK